MAMASMTELTNRINTLSLHKPAPIAWLSHTDNALKRYSNEMLENKSPMNKRNKSMASQGKHTVTASRGKKNSNGGMRYEGMHSLL